MAYGIDVYTRYQSVRDWHAVRGARYEWCYIKMSDGTATRSEGGYTAGGHSAGMAMGGYHYAQFGDARRQADLFLDRCEYFGATDLAPALDMEHPFSANSTALNFTRGFLRRVRERRHRPALYANNSMCGYLLPKLAAEFPELIRWVARYSSNDNGFNKVRPSMTYEVHQFSQYGHVPGISAGSVDLNDGIIPHNHGGGGATVAAVRKIGGDEVAQIYSCPPTVGGDGKVFTAVHVFCLPVGVNSTVTNAAWLSFKCGNPGTAESVQLMSIRGDDQAHLDGGQYPVDKRWEGVAADHTRVYVQAADGSDQFTAYVRSANPYSLCLEIQPK